MKILLAELNVSDIKLPHLPVLLIDGKGDLLGTWPGQSSIQTRNLGVCENPVYPYTYIHISKGIIIL